MPDVSFEWYWAFVAFVAGGVIVWCGMTAAAKIESLTREEEQKCVQHILKDGNIGVEERQELLDALQEYALDINYELTHLPPKLEAIIRTVTNKWQ